MGDLLRPILQAARALARTPRFALLAIATLGVGIGANLAVFGLIDTVLLQPLGFPDADRLVRVQQVIDAPTRVAPVRLAEWRDMSASFAALTGYYVEDASESSGEFAERVRRAAVTGGFFETWGVKPALGRAFSAAEYAGAGNDVVVISDAYWQSRFARDPRVVGRTVRIGERELSVIGVMPASFRFPERDVAMWWPYAPDAASAVDRDLQWYVGIGRLAPGVSPTQARDELAAVQARLAGLHPDSDASIAVSVVSLKEHVVGGVRSSLWMLFGAVALLLLITCSNVAALLVTRMHERMQQTAVRVALGASRRQVAVPLFIESTLLVAAGAAVGVAIATVAFGALRALAPELPRIAEASLNARLFAIALVSAAIVVIPCAVLPALRGSRTSRTPLSSARGDVASGHRLQWTFVSAQVALSIVLLVGAGLLLRSFAKMAQVDPGFDPANVLVLRVSGDWSEKQDPVALERRIDSTLAELKGIPGVEATASAWQLPGLPTQFGVEFELLEGGIAREDSALLAQWRTVAPGYFAVTRIPRLAGELCRSPASASGSRQVMVNEAFATRYFGTASPVGRALAWEGGSETGRIAGIVGNARESGIDSAPAPTVYACDSAPNPFPWLLLRTQGDPLALAASVRARMKSIEPLRSVYELSTLEARIDGAYAQHALRARLLGLFAFTALGLTCLGVYGTLAYVVSLRRREIGLRMALGASASRTVGHFIGKALRTTAIACVIGVGLAMALTRGMASMLYDTPTWDPLTFMVVVGLVFAVSAAAALVPALRASRIEPTRALREG